MNKYFRRPRQWEKECWCPNLLYLEQMSPQKTLHVEVWGNKMKSELAIDSIQRPINVLLCLRHSTIMFFKQWIQRHYKVLFVLGCSHWKEIIVTKFMHLIVLLRHSKWSENVVFGMLAFDVCYCHVVVKKQRVLVGFLATDQGLLVLRIYHLI